MFTRNWVYGFSIAVILAVASPLLRHPSDDSYPLSTYPMFSHRRSRPWLARARGIASHGRMVALDPKAVANDEVMQATVAVKRAIASGPEAAHRLCQSIASRLMHTTKYDAVRWVELVTEQHDPVAYFSQATPSKPLATHVHARCKVPVL